MTEDAPFEEARTPISPGPGAPRLRWSPCHAPFASSRRGSTLSWSWTGSTPGSAHSFKKLQLIRNCACRCSCSRTSRAAARTSQSRMCPGLLSASAHDAHPGALALKDFRCRAPARYSLATHGSQMQKMFCGKLELTKGIMVASVCTVTARTTRCSRSHTIARPRREPPARGR